MRRRSGIMIELMICLLIGMMFIMMGIGTVINVQKKIEVKIAEHLIGGNEEQVEEVLDYIENILGGNVQKKLEVKISEYSIGENEEQVEEVFDYIESILGGK